MKRERTLLSLLLVLMLLTLTAITGCGPKTSTTTPTTPTTKPDDSAKENASGPYSQIDLSKPYTVKMYVLGDTPKDTQLVVDEINRNMKEEYNTSLELIFLPWSDYETKYSLILAGGEDVDIMYTSSWCFYYTESAKGAFKEITDDFLTRAMPQTKKTQLPESWKQVTLGNKIYAVPRNQKVAEFGYVAIRDDLREKYNLNSLTDWKSLEDYLLTIAEKETPKTGMLAIAANKDNSSFLGIWNQQYEIMSLNKDGIWPHYTYKYNGGTVPKADDFFFYWGSDIFRDFCKRAKYMREKGVWSKDAITNTISLHDAYANGQGAAIAWNSTVFSYGKKVEQNIAGAKAGFYDISSDKVVTPMPYVNDCFAIAASSKNPDRAGMVLDLLKNDTKYYRLIQGGIEGKHYIKVDDKHFKEGPDAANYPWVAFAWGLNKEDLEKDGVDPRQSDMEAKTEVRMKEKPTSGFVFDEQPVKNEVAAINAIRDEYLGILTLGMVDDVDAKVDEMVAKMKKAGVDRLEAEGKAQYQKWLDSVQK